MVYPNFSRRTFGFVRYSIVVQSLCVLNNTVDFVFYLMHSTTQTHGHKNLEINKSETRRMQIESNFQMNNLAMSSWLFYRLEVVFNLHTWIIGGMHQPLNHKQVTLNSIYARYCIFRQFIANNCYRKSQFCPFVCPSICCRTEFGLLRQITNRNRASAPTTHSQNRAWHLMTPLFNELAAKSQRTYIISHESYKHG